MRKILIYLSVIFTPLAHAELTDFKVATWNLQGSSAQTESKWNINVRQLISGAGAVNILAIQEAGSPPSTAQDTGRVITAGVPVRELTWNLSTNSRPQTVFIYFASLDIFAGRVNLAIVSDRRADDVIILPAIRSTGRPLLGVRFGNDAFFTTHALASRNNDAADLVGEVFDFFRTSRDPVRQATNWMVLGDFNRSPSSLEADLPPPVRIHTQIFSPDAPTQSSGGTLDYAITGNSVAFIPPNLRSSILYGNRRTQASSDHFPVGVFFNSR
ncbi:cytolethal distending toxin subunit B family protein [Salmonella enterica]|uniref:Cytolethal distending toxin subunit B family protein n=5 Tax=Salmonella enterica TaxID=28901 RepID=A0A3U4YGW9_SALET|nr:cytolethal distending toxin subunit B family protein [Salmonella enterica]EAA3462732.1 cytolethal distending toxin subunit B family protein [Salmonella enterica subsp. enterica serovar Miami]EAA4490749.1 cytolethal distending toxin subunit B family protein [Salmonella enterica subsp. enterica]EAA6278011.1 cytolethal distending toxin subunit B family protein [Salmonella enterica subsp. enterica serovar Telhashomer]EBM1014680.1 cytolethal distending toxin subunit B family protein [Salmonella e